MKKKLRILLVFSKLEVSKHLIYIHRMHNLYAIFAKFLDICKQKAGNLVNSGGNRQRVPVVFQIEGIRGQNAEPYIPEAIQRQAQVYGTALQAHPGENRQ